MPGFVRRLRIPALLLLICSVLVTTARAQIAPAEYAARRAALRSELGEGLYLFTAGTDNAGRQNPDFRYLTGCLEPDGILLMLEHAGTSRDILFLRPPRRGSSFDPAGSELAEIGRRGGLEVKDLNDFESELRELLPREVRVLITPLRSGDETVAQIFEIMSQNTLFIRPVGGEEGLRFLSPSRELSRMRGLKSEAEIDLLQVASDITRLAQVAAMRTCEPGRNEFELQAVIEYTFARYGAQRPGFSSIIGSGSNSLVLHYSENTAFMAPDDVVVMDVGAEYFGYTSDVTRTIPVDGTFSPEQRDIYEIVLAANLACARLAENAGTPYRVLRDEARRVLGEGLARIGLIENPEATVPGRRSSQVGLYFYHGLGHGIGLEVHDSMPDEIIPGSCFTIEPGIYVRPDVVDRLGSGPEAEALGARIAPAVAKYANIGIRIEDSFAFTDRGLVCLSAGTPRTIAEIEAVMAGENLAEADRDTELVELYRRYRIPPP